MKVYMEPNPQTAPDNNGIGRVIKAIFEYAPKYGIEMTGDPDRADVVAYHAGTANGERVDVLHCHGMYWMDLPHAQFTRFHAEANKRVIEAARRAKVITVPSRWVSEPFRRDMRIAPTVIGHGINVSEWHPGENGGYILWNKNRPTDVCDPTPAGWLAEKGMKVMSTFAPQNRIIPGLTITGLLPFAKMKPIIEQAAIYLATTPETFGIGTLEAMICGVPILGYNWCGTADLITHKETGWLAEPGDLVGLWEGAKWLNEHRSEIGANAREFAKRFDWPAIIENYAAVYEAASKPDAEGISVVITNHNYAAWVGGAIHSCLNQTVKPDEIIVVDDGSTDGSLEILEGYKKQKKIRLLSQPNLGVAAARNNGITMAKYPFILTLDADDEIESSYIAAVYPVIKRDRGIGVAYTGLKFMDPSGHVAGNSVSKDFLWSVQSRFGVPPPTCVTSCAIFRKSMWERAGGYRQEYAPGEDAEFWTRGLSLGFTAVMATRESLFRYRGHEGSESRTKDYVRIDDDKPWITDKLYPFAAPAEEMATVYSYDRPVVSVIIPVGPGHERFVDKAIRSIIGQTCRSWELIVIDDSDWASAEFGKPLKKRYPFINILKTPGRIGAGAARNVGIVRARGKFLLFLDADDWIAPTAIEKMLNRFVETERYVYPDFYAVSETGALEQRRTFDYNREVYLEKQVMHSVTALVPTEWARDVDGFDPGLPGWEEYDFYMKLAIKGYCGTCIHEPLLYYRLYTGTRRQLSQKMASKLNAGFKDKFGGADMAKGCCGGGAAAILDAKRALNLIPRENADATASIPSTNEVRLEFTGAFVGPVGYHVNGRVYYGARDDMNRFINAAREDVPGLLATGRWKVAEMPASSPQQTAQAERATTVRLPAEELQKIATGVPMARGSKA